MNVKIEDYRGFEIVFNTENEKFSYSADSGTRSERQSYSTCTKLIDDFLKNNTEFIPFKVRQKEGTNDVLTIVGIRKDNRFVYDKNGKKNQIRDYHERDYILYLESDNETYAKISDLKTQREKISQFISALYDSIITPTLKDIKKNYLIP